MNLKGLRNWLWTGFALMLAVLMLSACGGGGGTEGSGVAVASITITAGPDIPADGTSSTAITVQLADGSGQPVPAGTGVAFTTTLGRFPNGQASYSVATVADTGTVVLSLIAGSTPGTASVKASSSGVSQSVNVTFTAMPAIASSLAVSLSQPSVKSDNSNSAAVTATVRDQYNAGMSGVQVIFNASGGQLGSAGVQAAAESQPSPATVTTNGQGQAQILFKSGTAVEDKINRTVTVTVTAPGLPARQVPIQITGTAVSLAPEDVTSITIGSQPVNLIATVTDAGSVGISGAQVAFTAQPEGIVEITPAGGTTAPDGTFEAELKGLTAGTVTVYVESQGATASKVFTVGAAGSVFGIIEPAVDPYSLSVSTDLNITVNAPAQSKVRFSTTVGTLTGASASGQTITQNVVGGSASATLRSTLAGVATVQVFDADNPATTDSIKVYISPRLIDAAQISLQANATVVKPSTGGIKNTVILKATVRTANEQPVGNVPVAFAITRPTGGGEYISPTIAYTNNDQQSDSFGSATAIFTAGSLPSDAQGVVVTASVAGMPGVGQDSVSIIIGGTAGSVTIGGSSKINTSEDNTYYIYPMSVLVTDSSGAPVPGAVVSLSVWPVRYATGYWVEVEENKCEPFYLCILPNEDVNRNLILDVGEDVNEDGILTPPLPAAGSLPATVTTDENGIANFDFRYLKTSAVWIEAEITATTLVSGTETRSTYTQWLSFLKDESCNLPNSPYQTKTIGLTADPNTLMANGTDTSIITAIVVKADGSTPVNNGELVKFTVVQGTGTLSAVVVPTVGGVAQVTYRASYAAGTEKIQAQVVSTPCAYATVDITLRNTGFPSAGFDWTDMGDQNRVLFADTSVAAAGTVNTSWAWTFVGGTPSTSTQQNPGTVSFGHAGSYEARLTVTNNLGLSDTAVEAVKIAAEVSVTAPAAAISVKDNGDGTGTFADASLAVSGTVIVDWEWVFDFALLTLPSGTIAFNENSPAADTITRTGGDFTTEGYVNGTQVKVVGSLRNDGIYTIISVTNLTLTLSSADNLVDESAGESAVVRLSSELRSTARDPGLIDFGEAGNYVVRLTVMNNNGESDSAAVIAAITKP